MDQPLWTPSADRVARANLTHFIAQVARDIDPSVTDYASLYRLSLERPLDFWPALWTFTRVIGDRGERVAIDLDRMPGARFFPDARLNFAENLLRRNDDTPAIVFHDEAGRQRSLTTAALRHAVEQFASALRRLGIGPGDRVAGYLPNIPETVVAALGTAAIGAVWSSCSPDFGVQGVLDRFGQIAPTVLVAVDGYAYAGKSHDSMGRTAEIARALPRPAAGDRRSLTSRIVRRSRRSRTPCDGDEFLASGTADGFSYERFPFNHPLYIMFSSGTTGVPKCIVHGAGGTLIQHLKEHQLHCDIRRGDRVFYFTTCGWMMWNWLVSALASEATLIL